ncbi:MAG: PEP/pyruvate-binding domain-containing protein [Acidilobus sp.]
MTCRPLGDRPGGHEVEAIRRLEKAGLPVGDHIDLSWPPTCSTSDLGLASAIARPSLEGPILASYLASYEVTRLASGDLSGWSAEVDEVARGLGLKVLGAVIQGLPQARASGLSYSLDPVTGMKDVIVQSVLGLHLNLLRGAAPHDTFVIERRGLSVLEVRVLWKPTALIVRGGRLAEVSLADGWAQSINDEEAVIVARLTLRAEEVIGGPVELEWALEDVGLRVLGARLIPPELLPPPRPEGGQS